MIKFRFVKIAAMTHRFIILQGKIVGILLTYDGIDSLGVIRDWHAEHVTALLQSWCRHKEMPRFKCNTKIFRFVESDLFRTSVITKRHREFIAIHFLEKNGSCLKTRFLLVVIQKKHFLIQKKVSLVQVCFCSKSRSIRDDPYWTSRKNSLELIEQLSSMNEIYFSLGFLLREYWNMKR